MLLDDAGGGVAGGVQRIEGEQRAADGDHLQQCSDRRELAILVVKVEAGQRHPGGVLEQRRGLVAQAGHRGLGDGQTAIQFPNPVINLVVDLLYGFVDPRVRYR